MVQKKGSRLISSNVLVLRWKDWEKHQKISTCRQLNRLKFWSIFLSPSEQIPK
jgi:hypothetical protein